MILAMSLIGLRKFSDGIPLTFTCSAAISAACHQPLPEDKEAYRFPVQRGVVSQDPRTSIGHCSFTTARVVAPPIPGNQYA